MNKIIFAIKGTLKDFYGSKFPTYNRPSPLFIERAVNGSIDLIAITSHEPAIYDNGNFVVTPGIVNFLTYSDDLKNPEWIAGSNVFIRRDTTRGAVSIRQEADSVAVIAGRGQDEESRRRQILRRSIHLEPDKTYTAWTLLQLTNGIAGISDVFRAVQDGKILAQISLGEWLNNEIEKTKALEIQFKPEGNKPVHLEFLIENSLTLNITGVQVEQRNFRSFFVYQQQAISPVEPTVFYYHQSPLNGLNTFGVLGAIEYWRGDGAILECGDFKIRIENKKLSVYVGTALVSTPHEVPEKFRFYVQTVSESQTVSIYIDGKLVARVPSPNLYRVTESPIVLSSQGVRCFEYLLCTEGLFEDGRIENGQFALKDVRHLFEMSPPIPSEMIGSSTQKFIGKPVEIPAAVIDESGITVPGYVGVRMPFLAIDPLQVEKVFPSTLEVQVNSTLAFKPGRAFIQTLQGADIRTVQVVSMDDASRRLKLDTVDLVTVGQIISQPAPNGETIIPWQNYRVEFLYPMVGVALIGSYGDGIILSNKTFESCTVIPVYEINL
jgi:hypothetical protein